MSHTKETAQEGTKQTFRLEIFSDGVFAIAITLLVLELIQNLHPQNGERLLRYYLHHWQPFLAFLIGFLTILVCWINHHLVFGYIQRTDSKLPWVNGFILLLITFTPFPTAIVAEYLETEGRFALAIFGINYFLIALGSYCICAYAYNKRLIDDQDRVLFHHIKLTYGYSIMYTLIAFSVCFLSIPVAIVMYMLLFYVFAFPKEFALRLLKRKQGKMKKVTAAEDKPVTE